MIYPLGFFALIPATLLVTISFFVLFATKKMETAGLKTFGIIVAVLLWISAAMVFVTGFTAASFWPYHATGHMQGWGTRGGHGMMWGPGAYMQPEGQPEGENALQQATPVPKTK